VLTLVNEGNWAVTIAFSNRIVYTKVEIGGVVVNQFEKDVQYQGNDAIDSGIGFGVSFAFFAIMFIIATVIKLVG